MVSRIMLSTSKSASSPGMLSRQNRRLILLESAGSNNVDGAYAQKFEKLIIMIRCLPYTHILP